MTGVHRERLQRGRQFHARRVDEISAEQDAGVTCGALVYMNMLDVFIWKVGVGNRVPNVSGKHQKVDGGSLKAKSRRGS